MKETRERLSSVIVHCPEQLKLVTNSLTDVHTPRWRSEDTEIQETKPVQLKHGNFVPTPDRCPASQKRERCPSVEEVEFAAPNQFPKYFKAR